MSKDLSLITAGRLTVPVDAARTRCAVPCLLSLTLSRSQSRSLLLSQTLDPES